MKLKVQRGSKGVFQKRADALRQNLKALAQQGARTAELKARESLMVNVYRTERGGYRRTRNLFRQVYAEGEASRTSLGIHVGDRAEYASFVEFGTGPYALSEQQLKAYLDALPPGGLLRFGRSGKAYMLPGPYIAPALFYARHLTHVRARALLRELWA